MERAQAKSFVEANVSCTCGLMITGGLSFGSTTAERLLEFVASEHTGANHRVSVTISTTIHESELLTPRIVRARIDQYHRRTESRPPALPVDGAFSATENGMTGQSKRKTPTEVWDPTDEKRLRAMHADGESPLEIAVVTGRPRYLIESVLQGLGLVGNPDPLNLRTAMRQRVTKQLPTAHQSWWNNKELEWWQREELDLIDLRLKGVTPAEISRLLSRPEASVLRRLKELRLTGTAPRNPTPKPTVADALSAAFQTAFEQDPKRAKSAKRPMTPRPANSTKPPARKPSAKKPSVAQKPKPLPRPRGNSVGSHIKASTLPPPSGDSGFS